MPSYSARTYCLLSLSIILLLPACSQDPVKLSAPVEPAADEFSVVDSANAMPEFPVDAMQPWESDERNASGISEDSELQAGREWFQTSLAGVTEIGEGARLDSQAGASSFVIHRIPVADESGVLAVDANLLDNGSSESSEFFIGLADFSSGRWSWHGPFSENHVRLSLAMMESDGLEFSSGLGNTFVATLVYAGNAVDLVSVSVEPGDALDDSAPGIVQGLSGNSVRGAVELDWDDNPEADLAGYLVYWSATEFINPSSAGVKVWPSMQGSPGMLLPLDGSGFVRVVAVDYSGNLGPASDLLVVEALDGNPAPLLLLATSPSVLVGSNLQLTASGSESYDWDIDGDGSFDVLDDATGSQLADTDRLGVIRPRVRGRDATGEAVAHGSVSLFVSGNSRPVAEALADVASGPAPLAVQFSGTASEDFDGEIVGGGWDFDGDGTYDIWDDTDIVHVTAAQHTYTDPGVYNARLRVVDNDGSWDVDTLSIFVTEGTANVPPEAVLTPDPPSGEPGVSVFYDAGSSNDTDGFLATYEWDIDGNGIFGEVGVEADNANLPAIQLLHPEPELSRVAVRVTDNSGAQSVASVTVPVRGWIRFDISPPLSENYASPSITLLGGRPAVAFNRGTNGGALNYARSSTVTGDRPEDWAWIEVTTTGPRICPDVESVAGKPAIACYDPANEELLYLRSNSAEGLGQLDWEKVIVANLDANGQELDLEVVNGTPAIAYEDAGPGSVNFAFSSTASGVASEDWDSIVITASGAVDPDLAIVSGEPAIAYSDFLTPSIVYAKSSTADGQSPGNWSKVNVDDVSGSNIRPSLCVVNGYPAIAYFNATSDDLRYVSATNTDAFNSVHWLSPIVVDSTNEIGDHPDLIMLQGRPSIAYFYGQSDDVEHAVCSTPFGMDPADWDTRKVDVQADNGPDRIDSVMAGGYLAVVYDGLGSDIGYALLIH